MNLNNIEKIQTKLKELADAEKNYHLWKCNRDNSGTVRLQMGLLPDLIEPPNSNLINMINNHMADYYERQIKYAKEALEKL